MRVLAAFLALVLLVPYSLLAVALLILDCISKGESQEIPGEWKTCRDSLAGAGEDLLRICVDGVSRKKQ